MAVLYAFLTVLAWGAWLVPSQEVRFSSPHVRTLYVSLASLAISFAVLLSQGTEKLTWQVFWPPFIGGQVWAFAGFCAFTATEKLGMARAAGLWAPLNILTGMFWGWILFGEFNNLPIQTILTLLLALLFVIGGIVMIIFARGTGGGMGSNRQVVTGLLAVLGAGILWGSYFLPIQISKTSMWIATFPLTVGMVVGSLLFVITWRVRISLPSLNNYGRTLLSGALWCLGNYGMLLLTAEIGTGKGFAISQMGTVFNAVLGIFWLKDPPIRTRAAGLTFTGVALATLGGILLGSIR